MARNDVTGGSSVQAKPVAEKEKVGKAAATHICSNCSNVLEPVGNRLFLMYKRARLPQPKPEALVCGHCGWVEGDDHFQALLEERINHN